MILPIYKFMKYMAMNILYNREKSPYAIIRYERMSAEMYIKDRDWMQDLLCNHVWFTMNIVENMLRDNRS